MTLLILSILSILNTGDITYKLIYYSLINGLTYNSKVVINMIVVSIRSEIVFVPSFRPFSRPLLNFIGIFRCETSTKSFSDRKTSMSHSATYR